MRGAVLLALLLASPAFADGPYFEPSKPKAAKRRIATTSRVVTVPDRPEPVCRWSVSINAPAPCACWYERVADAGPRWGWKECPPPEPEAVLEPAFIPEPQIVQFNEKAISPIPTSTSSPAEQGLRLSLEAWSLAGFSGEADRKILTGGRLSVDGPVAHAWSTPVRMFLQLDVSALPGQSLSLTSESFGRSAELRGGLYARLAESWPADQHITTSLVAWGGFATLTEDAVAERYLRSAGVGIRLAEEVGGAELALSFCRHEAAGYIGTGQVCLGGSAPIVGTKRALVLGGDAVLNLSRATVTPQRDVLRLWIGASIGDLVAAVRNR